MPTIAGVDVSNWCLAAGAAVVLTPAAAYAYLLHQGRQRRAFFAATPQPEREVRDVGQYGQNGGMERAA